MRSKKLLIALTAVILAAVTAVGAVLIASAADGTDLKDYNVKDTASWSFPTLDGKTVTSGDSAGKIRVLIFYRANGMCPNSNSTIKSVSDTNWAGSSSIDVIAVGCGEDGEDEATVKAKVEAFKKQYAVGSSSESITYCYATYSQLWSAVYKYERLMGNDTSGGLSLIFAVNYITDKDGNFRFTWQGAYSAANYGYTLSTLGAVIDENRTVTPGVETHTKAEIAALFKSNPIDIENTLVEMEKAPSLSEPYAPGKMTKASQQSALDTLNFMRYIAGLSHDLTINETKNEYAEAAAFVNYLNGNMSHYPKRPAVLADASYDELYKMAQDGAVGSNLGYKYNSREVEPNINNEIPHGWLADADEYNRERLGHRRWFLNPFYESVGFGVCYDQNYYHSAVYVRDDPVNGDGSESMYNDWRGMTVPWPAQVMPTEYFEANYPWSLSVGEKFDYENTTVKLVRTSDGKTWNFSSTSADGSFYCSADGRGFGSPECVVFIPADLTEIRDGDLFEVTVNLAQSDGSVKTVKYTVDFFSLTNYSETKPEDTTTSKPADTTAPKPEETTAPKPEETTAPKPVETTAPKPEETTAPKPVETTAPKPEETTAPKPVETTEPVTEPETEPVTEPETTPVTEPETTPVTEPETTPVTEPETTPVTEPETTPVTEPETTPVTEPETTPVTEPETTPVTEPETTPVTEPETTPVTEPETTPVTEPETTPVTEPETAPVTEPETTPVTTPETTEPLPDTGLTDSENDITLTFPEEDADDYKGLSLDVEKLDADYAGYGELEELLGEISDRFVPFDIKLLDSDGNAVQPIGSITLTIPIPTGWDASSVAVYHVDDKGTMTKMNSSVTADGKYVSFTTDHLSVYVLASTKPSGTDAPTTSAPTPGTDAETGGETRPPVTGDSGFIALFACIGMLAAGTTVVSLISVKRRSK